MRTFQMDTFGSVDPYAIVFLEGTEHRTKTIKGSYTPSWNETFSWNLMEVEKGCRSGFVVQINDWDAASKDDEVGNFSIPASRMSEVVRARIGWEGEETFPLSVDDCKAVVGHDKQRSEVTVKISVIEIPNAFGALEIDQESQGPRQINVTVVSAKHLPKVLVCMYVCMCVCIYI
jgi:Ca2+-dependent lipid-binding protein